MIQCQRRSGQRLTVKFSFVLVHASEWLYRKSKHDFGVAFKYSWRCIVWEHPPPKALHKAMNIELVNTHRIDLSEWPNWSFWQRFNLNLQIEMAWRVNALAKGKCTTDRYNKNYFNSKNACYKRYKLWNTGMLWLAWQWKKGAFHNSAHVHTHTRKVHKSHEQHDVTHKMKFR